jgi:DNA processing protein
MQRDEVAAWLRLALTPGLGNNSARRLLAAFGLPGALFEQSEEALAQVVDAAKALALRSEPADFAAQLDATWRWLEESPLQRRILTLSDAGYPPGLLQTEDPPLMLYVMGAPVTEWPAAIAVVGSRNPTPQGADNARQFARSFARSGFTVVSGLALGVDAAAHEGALEGAAEGQLATIAVVGTGLDRVYPRQNLQLAHRIADRGVIISEYPLGTPPLAPNFPRRNRIISALSQGTLVVEAALKSGSLITAKQATEQGREVFAIPGSIHSPQSRGCHALIREGAKLVESAQDVLEELRGHKVQARPTQAAIDMEADENEGDAEAEDSLLAAVGYDPVSLDALVARTGMAASHLQAKLLEYEMRGELKRLAGGLFQRIGSS